MKLVKKKLIIIILGLSFTNNLEQVIGFRLGDYKSGSNEVVSPQACKNISNEVKNLVLVCHRFLYSKNELILISFSNNSDISRVFD